MGQINGQVYFLHTSMWWKLAGWIQWYWFISFLTLLFTFAPQDLLSQWGFPLKALAITEVFPFYLALSLSLFSSFSLLTIMAVLWVLFSTPSESLLSWIKKLIYSCIFAFSKLQPTFFLIPMHCKTGAFIEHHPHFPLALKRHIIDDTSFQWECWCWQSANINPWLKNSVCV